MKRKNKFPTFWFEGNLFFNWVNNVHDLKKLFTIYEDTLSIDQILDDSMNALGVDYIKYGLRAECNGTKTLRMFLTENDVHVPICGDASIDDYIGIIISGFRDVIIDDVIYSIIVTVIRSDDKYWYDKHDNIICEYIDGKWINMPEYINSIVDFSEL